MTSLRGAVADADSITQYLENSLKVGKSRIRNIRNAEATRAAIISAFIALENHPEIGLGDPILIYYAGHGASVKPPIGWEAGGAGRIQMLIPHDYHTDGVQGIPDRTISVLLTRLAKAKGDNIVRLCTSFSLFSSSDFETDCHIRLLSLWLRHTQRLD